MSEFSEKVSSIKESMKDHVFSPPTGDENVDIIDESNDNDFNGESNDNNAVESSESFSENQNKTRKKSGYRSRSDRHKLQSRLDQAAYEKNLYLSQNRELMARLKDQERLLAENQYKAVQNEQQRDAYYEDNLGTKEQSILTALKVAKEEGDIDKEVALSHELSKVAAEKTTYDLYKSQISPQQQQQQQQQQYNDYPEIENSYVEPYVPYDDEPENEHLDNWLENNPWADPESHNYSPRLRQEVEQIAHELDGLLINDGNAHAIGTSEYYTSLDNLMRAKHATDSNKQQRAVENSSRAAPNRYVAPVSRNGSSMADQYMSENRNSTRRSVPLTQEEYNIARNLQIKLPNGRMATPDEAIRRYADAKRLDNHDDGRTNNHPHRLVIN